MQPWFTVYFFDIGHLCYDQLTPVKTRYLLTCITWPYRRLKFTVHWGHVFFWSLLLTKCWFSVGSRAHVNLTCWKQGRIVWKPINANPGLKVHQIITYSSIQIFFTVFVSWSLRFLKLKTEAQTMHRKPHRKLTKLKSKLSLILG